MKHLYKMLIIGIIILFFQSCSKNNQTKLADEMKSMNDKISKLGERIRELEIEKDVENALKDSEESVIILPVESGFAQIKFGMGYLTVSIKNIEPYANGSKVTLWVGNPLASNFIGISMKFEYGNYNEKNIPIMKGTKKESFVEPLKRGSWTIYTVILNGIIPQNLGYIQISEIKYRMMSLPRGN